MNTSIRSKKTVSAASNDFHRVRVQEFEYANAAKLQPPPVSSSSGSMSLTPPATSYFFPSLQSLCTRVLAEHFATMPEIDQLRDEGFTALYDQVVAQVPASEAEVPLPVSVARIKSEAYWRRCAEARWSTGQLSRYLKQEQLGEKQYGWKRLYLEHVLSDYLLSLPSSDPDSAAVAAGRKDWLAAVPSFAPSPGTTGVRAAAPPTVITPAEAARLADLCATCRDYVHTVELPAQVAHLQLYSHLFTKVPGILHFRLTYTSGNGQNSGFQEEDAAWMAEVLRKYTSLQELQLPGNQLRLAHVYPLVQAAATSSALRRLDLSHNWLEDKAAAALAYLLVQPTSVLEELDLTDNQCTAAGATALAEALGLNTTLRVLNLNQNAIADDAAGGDGSGGGPALLRAAAQHRALHALHLSHNRLGAPTLQALCEVLPTAAALTTLTLAGNAQLGAAGGAALAEELYRGATQNTKLSVLDVRGCQLPPAVEQSLDQLVHERVQARRTAELAVQEDKRRAETEREAALQVQRMRAIQR